MDKWPEKAAPNVHLIISTGAQISGVRRNPARGLENLPLVCIRGLLGLTHCKAGLYDHVCRDNFVL